MSLAGPLELARPETSATRGGTFGDAMVAGVAFDPPRDERLTAKRAFDAAASGALLVLFLPFLAVAAIAIVATSRGSALHSQLRVGRGGRPFRMLKLRTMVEDAERETGPVWATSRDPRVTPVGRILRDTHLDELPQLWNVLKGEMSLVGPRPERPLFVNDFAKRLTGYSTRHVVRPGITGLAQVRRGYDTSIRDVRRKLAFDLIYVRRRCMRLDMAILARTLTKTVPIGGADPR